MFVKCQICGKKIDRDIAYKKETNSGNKYYCSISEYELEEQRKTLDAENKERVYRLICNILQQNEIINSALWKEYNTWLKVATVQKIGDYLAENEEILTQSVSRLTGPLYNKIRYLSVVIGNQIVDWRPKLIEIERPKIVVEETIYDAPTQSLNKRRSLADLEDMF